MIDKTEIDFDSVATAARRDLWGDWLRPLYHYSPIGEFGGDRPMFVRNWHMGDLVLGEASYGSQVVRRHRQHYDNGIPPFLLLKMFRYGSLNGELGDLPVRLDPGEIVVMDFHRAYAAQLFACRVNSLIVTHDQIGYDPSLHPAVMKFNDQTVVGRVLRHTLTALFDELDRTTKAEAHALSSGLITLLRSVLFTDSGGEPRTSSYSAARAQLIRAYIERNLKSINLDADMILAEFNVSRATLYREFREEGGIERYILARRLDAALGTLAFGTAERGAVTRTAAEWCFSSTTYFSREFRRRFGMSPSDAVGQRETIRARSGGQDVSGDLKLSLEVFLRKL